MTRPVMEICWKNTYLMSRSSMTLVNCSIFSARPGAVRASASVAGGGAIRGLEITVRTSPPNTGASTMPSVAISLLIRGVDKLVQALLVLLYQLVQDGT